MKDNKLSISDLKVMEVLWNRGDTTAKEMAGILLEQVGWSKTTTYTVIKKCIDKGAVKRREPGFICQALLEKEQVQQEQTSELIDRLYDGAPDALVASLLDSGSISREELDRLKKLVREYE